MTTIMSDSMKDGKREPTFNAGLGHSTGGSYPVAPNGFTSAAYWIALMTSPGTAFDGP